MSGLSYLHAPAFHPLLLFCSRKNKNKRKKPKHKAGDGISKDGDDCIFVCTFALPVLSFGNIVLGSSSTQVQLLVLEVGTLSPR